MGAGIDTDRYTINCRNCEEETTATKVQVDFWKCDNCGYLVDGESGQITNETEKADFYRLYQGAKIAGLIDEPDVPRERERIHEWY